MSIKRKLKENEVVIDVDNDEKFDELVDAIQDIATDDVDIVDANTDEVVSDEEDTEEVDDSSILELPDDSNNDGIEEPSDDKEVTVNGDPVDDDEELLVEEGDEEVIDECDETGASLDDINAEAGQEINEELEITDYADPKDIGQFFDMSNKEIEDEISDPEEIIDDVVDEEEPSGLMKEGEDCDSCTDDTTDTESNSEEVITEDVNDELVDATPRSIPSGLDNLKGKIMSIAEEINSLTELTDDVETTSIIVDLYNSAVSLALDVEGAVDTYKELAEEEIEDEVEEVKGEDSEQ